ncbi:MAG: hypothetical protein RLZ14_1411 [Actinomycetota bacterium]
MATFETVDITSHAFALRMANLLVATRTRNGQSLRAVARLTDGHFTTRDLKRFERAEVQLDETTIDQLAMLYRCDLGTILPLRLPVMVTSQRVSAGGVHQEVEGSDPDSVLSAYLTLVRTLRRQKKAPVVDLRRDDIAVLAGFLNESHETVVHRLATLMQATQAKRTAMVGVLTTGAAVVGLVGSAMALESSDAATPISTDPVTIEVSTTVVVDTTTVTTDSVPDTASATSSPTTTIVIELPTSTDAPATTRVPVIVPVTRPPATTIPMIDTNLTTTTTLVDSGEPPIPAP